MKSVILVLLYVLSSAGIATAATMQVDGAFSLTLDQVIDLSDGTDGSFRPTTEADFSPSITSNGDGVAVTSGSIEPNEMTLEIGESMSAVFAHSASSFIGGFARSQNTGGGVVLFDNRNGDSSFSLQFSWSYLLTASLTADPLIGEAGVTQLSLELSSETAGQNVHVRLLEQLRETSIESSHAFSDSGSFTVEVGSGGFNVIELGFDGSGQVSSQLPISPVPLPATLGLFLFSLIGLVGATIVRSRDG